MANLYFFVIMNVILRVSFAEITSINGSDSSLEGRLLHPEQGCGTSKVPYRKIVGGEQARPDSFPWMALIGFMGGNGKPIFGCGGSLITSRHVLTAAHCVVPGQLMVRLGEYDLMKTTEDIYKDVKVSRAVKHPNYTSEFEYSDDIAIFTLESDVTFNDHIRPICLPLTEKVKRKSFTSSHPFVAGWGRLKENGKKSNVLMQVQLPVINNTVCETLYKKKGQTPKENQYGNSIMCAGNVGGGKDACQGDSGGPLMLPIFHKNKFPTFQIGIVSTGLGCARKDIVGIYTRIVHYMDWIENEVNRE